MTPTVAIYPFTALVGQELLQRALMLNAICPDLGGVLIAGERGTAKSTAARGLAALLPRFVAVRGCPYRCDPSDRWLDCLHCRETTETAEVAAPFVELPLGATEDRVAGSIDLERTLREGRPIFRAGLLAAAHRGILYIDEVNLLPDHLVDLLLDAAASGVHTVEREGVAVRHPARFVLIGTMNPDEGELRPQLADRFGLRVSVRTPTDPAERAEVIRRRLAFDADPVGFCKRWEPSQQALTAQLATARDVFARVTLNEENIIKIAKLCIDHGVEGLRADLAVSRASRALAALDGRTQVSSEDLQSAAELVLPHRTRTPPPSGHQSRFTESGSTPELEIPSVNESITPPGEPRSGTLPRMELITSPDLTDRGRRNPVRAKPKGRYVRAVRDETTCDVALDATLRAAASRSEGANGRLVIRADDLHCKVREDRRGTLVVFVVDASGSMGARRRMEAVKGVVLGLLADADRLRDEVTVIAVRGTRAEIILPPTSEIRIAEQALARLPAGGRTPLAHGLTLAADLIGRAARPVFLTVLSDGKANVALPGTNGDPWEQALAACAALTGRNVKAVVIDAEESALSIGRVRELAAALSAECRPLAALRDVVHTLPTDPGGNP